MPTGDDDPKTTTTSVPSTSGRRRGAVRPPVIDLEAQEVPAPADAASSDAAAETTSDTTSREPNAADALSSGKAAGEAVDAVVAATQGEGTGASVPEEAPELTASSPEESSEAPPAETDAASGDGGPGDPGGPPSQAPDAPLPTARRASVIAAGLIGAAVSLAIYLGLYYGGILPRDRSTMIDGLIVQNHELARRLAALEASAARTPRRDVTRELAGQIKALDTAVKELGAEPSNAALRRIRQLETRLEELGEAAAALPADIESRLKAAEDWLAVLDAASPADQDGDGSPEAPAAEPPAASSGSPADVAVGGSTDTPTSSPVAPRAAPASASLAVRLDAAERRLATLEAQPEPGSGASDEPPEAGASPLAGQVSSIESRLSELAAAVAKLSAEAGEAASADRLAGVETTLAALEGEVGTLRESVASTGAQVDSKIAAVEKTIDQRSAAESRAAAAALAVAALQRAVASGRPYEDELRVLRPLVPKDAGITVLEARAAAGVPTLEAIRNGFSTLADDIVEAGRPADGTVVDKLLSGARTLVKVRPAGPVDGDGRGAVVARIEADLAGGDLAEAERKWNTLDEAAKQVSLGWAGDLSAKVGADQELQQLSAQLAASVTGN